jgi:hypothetical protein
MIQLPEHLKYLKIWRHKNNLKKICLKFFVNFDPGIWLIVSLYSMISYKKLT